MNRTHEDASPQDPGEPGMVVPGPMALPTECPVSHAGVASKSFLALLATQFLGALNDNIFRWLAVPVGALFFGESASLSIGAVVFTLPYLVLMNAAGYLADRFDKRKVIVACKAAEVLLAMIVIASILFGNVYCLFLTVLLMGAQSSLFGPSKFAAIPELVGPSHISSANGLMAMVSVIAAALGMFVGLWLFDVNQTVIRAFMGQPLIASATVETPPITALLPTASVLIGIAIVGWFTSLMIRRLEPADVNLPFPLNPFRDTVRDLRVLWSNRALFRAALGVSFFWVLGMIAQLNMPAFGKDLFSLTETGKGLLLVVLVAGLAIGAVVAGVISRGHVELGIVPLGAMIIVIGSVGLCITGEVSQVPQPTGLHAELSTLTVMHYPSFWWTCGFLLVYGFGAGLFTVPLEAYVQHRSDVKIRGVVIAATNFLAFSMMSLAAVGFYLLNELAGVSPPLIFLLCGLCTLPVLVYIVWLLPQATVRFLVWLVSIVNYRVRVYGHENLPKRGGALLVANHVSWVDGFLLTLASSRPVRLMADADYFKNSRLITAMSKLFGAIPIHSGMGPKGLLKALKIANEAVANGELVCIFAEGQLTRTGQLQPFQRGLLRVVEGTNCPVVPVYLDQLWGSIFSYHGGKILWKWPRKWPYPVSISFGKPLENPDHIGQVRQAVQDLGVDSAKRREERLYIPVRRFIRKCKQAKRRVKVADSTSLKLTGGKLLAGTLIIKRQLRRAGIADDEQQVGVLLPPSVGGVLANTALAMSRKVAVNLNYTLSQDDLDYCVQKAGLRHVLTSRKMLEKCGRTLSVEPIYLEDFKERATFTDRLVAGTQAYFIPAWIVERIHRLKKIGPDDLMTIVFTSGSTGRPKGVMLSQNNVQSNIDAVDDLYHFKNRDSLLGVMPFFHSFGYTLSLWLTLTTPVRSTFHHNPLDARTVGTLCQEHQISIVMGTPTFLKAYAKRCTPEQMQHLELVVVGAEKLSQEIADAFQEKFGVLPTEGYGTTELAPLACGNVPNTRTGTAEDVGRKFGTVGRAIPGVSVKLVDPETGEVRENGEEGMLLVSGPNVMLGYLDEPEKSAEVLQDGWYKTGDMATIDQNGFVTITGRLSRFSKIGGEMVPHQRIEEELLRVAGINGDSTEVPLVVTAVPDPKKGERLVVLHRPLSKPVDAILKELAASNFPNLWLPSRDSFVEVESIPLLGTGKLDLKGVRELAYERFASASQPA